MTNQALKSDREPFFQQEVQSKRKLFVFDTHPIQYRSPVFVELARQFSGIEVFYFNEAFDGKKWWFHEIGKIPEQNFSLDLRHGFLSHILQTKTWKFWQIYSNFKALLSQERPAAVLIYGYYLPEHWILQSVCKQLQIPILFIGETYSEGNSSLRKVIKGPLIHLFFKQVAHFIAIGDKTHAFYRDWEIPKERITLAKYCVDTNFFFLEKTEAEQAKEKIRASLGIPPDAFVCLFVGRLFERKRPLDLLKIHQWYRENPNYHTVIVGNGPMEAELKEKAKDFKRLHLVGFKTQAETRDFYHAANVLVVPSEYETWGLVINEAFCCGIPAIVTSTCGASGDLVLHGETGFSYPMGNIPRAIAFLDRLVQKPEQAVHMGQQAFKRVRSQYTPQLFADAILKAFNSVICHSNFDSLPRRHRF